MRHFVLALMIVLLPLRGWVGDAMATEMATGAPEQSVSSIESGAHHAHSAMADADPEAKNSMHADCPDHAASPEDTPQAASGCHSCTACQICHSMALTPSLPQLASAAVSAAQPPAATPLFASAERAPGFKPPIS
jgi:hypothetical protein